MKMTRPLTVAALSAMALAGETAGIAHETTPTRPIVATPTHPQAAAAAMQVVDAFHEALRRGDTATAAALLADDALIYEGGGAERSKAQYASHHLVADAVGTAQSAATGIVVLPPERPSRGRSGQ